jgi:hypothetical protein
MKILGIFMTNIDNTDGNSIRVIWHDWNIFINYQVKHPDN